MNEKNRHVSRDKPIYSGNSIMVRHNGPLICKGDTAITLLNEDDIKYQEQEGNDTIYQTGGHWRLKSENLTVLHHRDSSSYMKRKK